MGVGPSTRPPGSHHGGQAGGGGEDLPVDHPRVARSARQNKPRSGPVVVCCRPLCGSHGAMIGRRSGSVGDAQPNVLLPEQDADFCVWRDCELVNIHHAASHGVQQSSDEARFDAGLS